MNDTVFVPTMVTQGYSIPFNSLSKSAFFLTTGVVYRLFRKKQYRHHVSSHDRTRDVLPRGRREIRYSEISSYRFSKFTRAST